MVKHSCDTGSGLACSACGAPLALPVKQGTEHAGMAELADAADSKSADPCDRGGSTPPPGTIKSLQNLPQLWQIRSGPISTHRDPNNVRVRRDSICRAFRRCERGGSLQCFRSGEERGISHG